MFYGLFIIYLVPMINITVQMIIHVFKIIYFQREMYLHFSKFVGVGLSSTLHEDSIRISSEKINMLDLNIHHFNEIFFLLNATVYK